jgi:OOP family OmpA-OmpF porin
VAAILEADGIQFDPGSSAIAAESAGTIAALTEALGACGGATFEIGGHTDDRGSSEGNLRLSRARAEAVLAALEAAGPEGVTLTARGYGEDAPIADNGTSEGRSANRRIEIRMLSGPETPDAAPAPGPSEDPTADDAAADTDQEAADDEP